MPHGLLLDVLTLIAASFVAVALLARRQLSPIVGYLAAGLLIGQYGANLVPASEGTRILGELGVALLMFFVGLEFSWTRLLAAHRFVFGAGGLQVGLTGMIAGGVAFALGAGGVASVVVGGALAMSSTAIIHKQLLDQDEATSPPGTLTTSILIFQDLVALPLIVLVGALDAREGETDPLGVSLRVAASVGAFLIAALLARRTVGRVLAWTARGRSNEPFLLAALLLIVGSAFVTEAVGLSLPVGAFIVGMVVGESDYRHQIENEIRPFRDLLLGIFFLTIGMTVNWSIVFAQPLVTFGALALLVMIKVAVAFMAVRLIGVDAVVALRAAVILAHCGELSLLILSQALATELVPQAIGQPALGAAALSMLFAPALIHLSGRVAAALRDRQTTTASDETEAALREASRSLQGHVIIAGSGPVGRLVAAALKASGVPYLALERDVERLQRARDDDHIVLFGDATRPDILKAAGVIQAGALVALLNSRSRLKELVHNARHLNATLPIIVSTNDDTDLEPLVSAGATHVFPENYAVGLALAVQALVAVGLSPQQALAHVRSVRAKLNPELRDLPASQ